MTATIPCQHHCGVWNNYTETSVVHTQRGRKTERGAERVVDTQMERDRDIEM